MKKLLSIVLSLVATFTCAFGVVGCNKPNNLSGKTVIYWLASGGCMSADWIEKASAEWIELNKDVSFEEGKKGVAIVADWKHTLGDGDLGPTSSYDLIFEEYIHVNDYVLEDKLVDITDLYNRPSKYNPDGKSIVSRILPEMRGESAVVQKNAETGKYETRFYALPFYEFSPGLVYDRDLFDQYNLYFAEDQSADSEGYGVDTKFGTGYFIGEPNGLPYEEVELSYGPDFEKGTLDDGMPKSLQELAILCYHMKYSCGIEPLQYPGNHADYSNILTTGLYASLAGFEALQSTTTFKGTIEVVGSTLDILTPVSLFDENTPLFEGATGVAKPQTEWVTIDQAVDASNGYLTQEQAAKYYACAFAQIAWDNQFYSKDARTNGTQSHTESQEQFMTNVAGSSPVGMLIENTYLWNEMTKEGVLDFYTSQTGGTKDPYQRNIRVMPLPSVVTNDAKETSQRTDWSNTLIDGSSCVLMVSKKYVRNEGKMNAIYDLIDYLYSDEQMVKFTKESGMYRGFDYQLSEADKEGLSVFTKSYFDLRENGKVMYHSGDNPVFMQNGKGLSIDIWGTTWALDSTHQHMISIMRDGGSFIDMFNNKKISKTQWASYTDFGSDETGTISWIDFGLDEAEDPTNVNVGVFYK